MTRTSAGPVVRYIRLAEERRCGPMLRGLLDDDERDRMRRLPTAALRENYALVHGRVRMVLAEFCDVDPVELHYSLGPRGKPETVAPAAAVGVHWNLSTSGDWALLGISPGRPVGVDLELVRVRPAAVPSLARYFPRSDREEIAAVSPAERPRAYHRTWVRKEAWAKARGLGVIHALRHPVAEMRANEPGGRVCDIDAPDGYVAAVCLESDGREAPSAASSFDLSAAIASPSR